MERNETGGERWWGKTQVLIGWTYKRWVHWRILHSSSFFFFFLNDFQNEHLKPITQLLIPQYHWSQEGVRPSRGAGAGVTPESSPRRAALCLACLLNVFACTSQRMTYFPITSPRDRSESIMTTSVLEAKTLQQLGFPERWTSQVISMQFCYQHSIERKGKE